MKPCICGGSNTNCRYCSGSGYVSDAVGLPQNRTGREELGPASELVHEPAPKPKAFVPRKRRTTITDLAWYLLFLLITFLIVWLVSK